MDEVLQGFAQASGLPGVALSAWVRGLLVVIGLVWLVKVLFSVLQAGARGQSVSVFGLLHTVLVALLVVTFSIALAFEG